MNYNDKLLEHYGQELGVECLLLETLIDSHRALSALAAKTREERIAEMNDIRQNVEKQVRQEITLKEYIAVRRLKKMNIQDVAELINSYNESFL